MSSERGEVEVANLASVLSCADLLLGPPRIDSQTANFLPGKKLPLFKWDTAIPEAKPVLIKEKTPAKVELTRRLFSPYFLVYQALDLPSRCPGHFMLTHPNAPQGGPVPFTQIHLQGLPKITACSATQGLGGPPANCP